MPDVKEVVLEDWESFEGEISRISEMVAQKKASPGSISVSDPLFRGQANQCWPLLTTLERFSKKPYSIEEYHRIVVAVAPAVASLTAKSSFLSPHREINLLLEDEERRQGDPGKGPRLGPPPWPQHEYEFMIYLRHSGFPSPLLDWSRSPYVAAFFAFPSRPSESCDKVALYAYVEYFGSGKLGVGGRAQITGLGPYARTHERHYSQQSQYTICTKSADEEKKYCNHEEAFGGDESQQDLLTKYVIPARQRDRFLSKLYSLNINAYSLFRDEGSLMQTLAYREIEKQVR